MNAKLKAKAKNKFETKFFKDMNTLVYRQIMENVRTHRDIRLLTDRRRNQLLSE